MLSVVVVVYDYILTTDCVSRLDEHVSDISQLGRGLDSQSSRKI